MSRGSCMPDARACSAAADDAPRARRYIPFAEGPRNCVGQSLAQTTLPITLAALLSHFTFRLADQVPLAPAPDGCWRLHGAGCL